MLLGTRRLGRVKSQLLYLLSYADMQIKMLTGRRNITPLLQVSIKENLFGKRAAAANPNPSGSLE